MKRITPGLLLAAAVFTTALVRGQQPPAPPGPQPTITFKAEVNYVEVDAVVTDKAGNPARNLTRDDFQVFEDGKLQEVTTFALIDVPIERADKPLFATQPIEPDVRSNARPFEGRLYVMVLDDLHTNALRSGRVKAAARQFIQRNLGANDVMAILSISGRADATQEFTANKRLLLAAVDKFMGRKIRSATAERLDEYFRTQDTRSVGDKVNDPADAERGFDARSALQTLRSLAEWMGGIRGRRKAILYLSEGIDYDITNVFDNRDASTIMDETRDTIAAATRANVAIYGIDPRGLTGMGDESIEISSLPDDTSLGLGPQSLMNELRLSQDSLRVLSDETGGFASVNSNDFRTAFDRVVRDNSSYYVLAYYPPAEKRDGRFHKIEVKMKRPGLEVRARRGYVAPKSKAPVANAKNDKSQVSPEVREAMESPLPVTGLTLQVFAAPFKGTAPNASVLLGIETAGRDLTFQQQGDKFVVNLELSYVAVDAKGKVQAGDRDAVNMGLKADTHERVAQTGMRVLNRINVPPGRYQIRIAGRESGTGHVGSVLYDLEVPDFAKESLSMSGLVLTSAAAGSVPTAKPDEQLKAMLPGPPAGLRDFVTQDEIALYVEVYDNDTKAPHKIDITTTVRADEGKTVYKTEDERSSAELQGTKGGYGYTAKIPLKDLAAGSYVLRVEARSRLGQGLTVSREVAFNVRVPRTTAPVR